MPRANPQRSFALSGAGQRPFISFVKCISGGCWWWYENQGHKECGKSDAPFHCVYNSYSVIAFMRMKMDHTLVVLPSSLHFNITLVSCALCSYQFTWVLHSYYRSLLAFLWVCRIFHHICNITSCTGGNSCACGFSRIVYNSIYEKMDLNHCMAIIRDEYKYLRVLWGNHKHSQYLLWSYDTRWAESHNALQQSIVWYLMVQIHLQTIPQPKHPTCITVT